MAKIFILRSAILIAGLVASSIVGLSVRAAYQPDLVEVPTEDMEIRSMQKSDEADSASDNQSGPNLKKLLLKSAPLEELIEALNSEDFNTRMRAVNFIGYRGQDAEEAVPALIKVLDIYHMRESALHALKAIGPSASAAIPALYNALTAYPEQPATRWIAAHALANIGELAIPTLQKGVDSNNLYERIWCRAALARIEGPKSKHLESLSESISSADEKTVLVAVRALTMIGSAAKPALPKIIAAMDSPMAPKKDIAVLLAQMGKDASPAIPQLVKLLDDSHALTRNRAAYALSKIGGADLQAAIPGLIRMLSAQEDHVRKQAAVTLGKIGPAGSPSIPYLIESLRDQDEHVRSAVAAALGEIAPNDATVHSALIEAMKDKSGRVRSKAAPVLAKNAPVTRELIHVFIRASDDHWAAVTMACEIFFRRVGPDDSELVPERYRRGNRHFPGR
jgi:HEAT repeat protein